MFTYILYWSTYPQWTKQFSNASQAIEAAKEYIRDLHEDADEFKLIQQVPIHIGPI